MVMDSEAKRLEALRLYRILDTATEKAFDDLTKMAALICETPISLVSLVDEDRQWFKSRYGLDAAETPRSAAFCAHAIEEDEVMVVEDAQADERFADNPLVTGDPNIRFYAGAPLRVASGQALGTLCVIDRQPRKLTETQRLTLEVLRDAVVSQLEYRRAAHDFKALASHIPVCAWCHKVRVSGDADAASQTWESLHEYLSRSSPVTHGICPDCREDAISSD